MKSLSPCFSLRQDAEYSIYPRLDKMHCSAFVPGPNSISKSYYDPLFPDLSTWDFVGLVPLAGKTTQMWQSQRKQGDKVGACRFAHACLMLQVLQQL